MKPSLDDLNALADWDTPALSNALDSLRLRPFNEGFTDGSITRQAGSVTMVGTAVTAKMVARDPGEDGIPVARLHELVAAVEEERFRRIKHVAGFPTQAIRACLEMGGLRPTDIDHVGVSRNPKAHLWRKALFALRNRPKGGMIGDRADAERR